MKKNINGLAWPAEQTTILELCSFLSETSTGSAAWANISAARTSAFPSGLNQVVCLLLDLISLIISSSHSSGTLWRSPLFYLRQKAALICLFHRSWLKTKGRQSDDWIGILVGRLRADYWRNRHSQPGLVSTKKIKELTSQTLWEKRDNIKFKTLRKPKRTENKCVYFSVHFFLSAFKSLLLESIRLWFIRYLM